MYNACNFLVTGPTLPLPILCPSIDVTGVASDVAEVKKASSAFNASLVVNPLSCNLSRSSFARAMIVRRVIPFKISFDGGRVKISRFEVTIQAFEEDPSVMKPFSSVDFSAQRLSFNFFPQHSLE